MVKPIDDTAESESTTVLPLQEASIHDEMCQFAKTLICHNMLSAVLSTGASWIFVREFSPLNLCVGRGAGPTIFARWICSYQRVLEVVSSGRSSVFEWRLWLGVRVNSLSSGVLSSTLVSTRVPFPMATGAQ